MLKLRKAIGLSVLLLIVGCGDDPEGLGDYNGASGASGSGGGTPADEPLSCCRIRMLCTHCSGCPSGSTTIYQSDDDDACKAWLEEPDYADGCPDYRGTQAIADCAD